MHNLQAPATRKEFKIRVTKQKTWIHCAKKKTIVILRACLRSSFEFIFSSIQASSRPSIIRCRLAGSSKWVDSVRYLDACLFSLCYCWYCSIVFTMALASPAGGSVGRKKQRTPPLPQPRPTPAKTMHIQMGNRKIIHSVVPLMLCPVCALPFSVAFYRERH